MRISLDTQYAIGDTVTIPDAHTTVDVKITDILVRVGYHGPAFAEITYLTNNPDFQSVNEPSITGLASSPTGETTPLAADPLMRRFKDARNQIRMAGTVNR